MTTYYASLGRDTDFSVPAGGVYTLLSFPFAHSDEHGMWSNNGYTITPKIAGIGCLELNIHWEAGNYTELRDVFTRDPYQVTSDPDNRTAYDHRAPSPGMQCFTKMHWLKVSPGTPLGVYVSQNDSVARKVTLAQLKLTIFPEA